MRQKIPNVRKRFRNRILKFLLAASFLPVLVWFTIGYYESIDFLGNFVEKELSAVSNETALRIETWKQRNQSLLTFLQKEIATRRSSTWQRVLNNAVSTEASLYTAAVIDLSGRCIVRSEDARPVNYADRVYFQKALAGKIYHEFLISRLYNRPAICSASPVRFDGQIKYVTTICAFADQIVNYFGTLKVGKTGYVFVVDDRDRVIAHPTSPMLTTQMSPAEHAILDTLHLRKEPQHGDRLEFQSNGKTYVSYIRPMSNGWKVIALQERHEILAWSQKYLEQPLLFTILTILALSLLTFYAIDKSTRPLHDLTIAANELGKTNFSVRVPMQGDDEMSSLAQSFNIMAERLQSTFQELKEKENLLERSRDDLNQKVSEQSQKLLYSAKMSCLGEMAGGIAHEINNPLAIISLLTQKIRSQMERGKASSEVIYENLQKIETTCLRITQIIRGLRAFSRDGSKDPIVRENLSSIVEDTVALCMESIRNKRIRLDIICPEGVEIECQPVQISQVLLNLLSNAKDAIAHLEERWIRVEAVDFQDLVQISVTDSGRGVSEHLREKIMQPFFTTKKVGEGTGLGLSICKGIVEQHNGRIFLNFEDRNTQFVLILPKRQRRRDFLTQNEINV